MIPGKILEKKTLWPKFCSRFALIFGHKMVITNCTRQSKLSLEKNNLAKMVPNLAILSIIVWSSLIFLFFQQRKFLINNFISVLLRKDHLHSTEEPKEMKKPRWRMQIFAFICCPLLGLQLSSYFPHKLFQECSRFFIILEL